MTTLRAASTMSLQRFLLGRVVPMLYLAALAAAVVLGSRHAAAQPRDASLASAKLTKSRIAHAASRAPKHHDRVRPHARKHRGHVARAHRVRVQIAQPPALRPVVSRSEDRIVSEPAPDPSPALVIRIAAVTTPATMQNAINACIGPVEIDWSADPSVWGIHPTEIAQHDYCGGAAFSSLSEGERVQVIGGGLTGTYVVNGNRRFAPSGSSASELDGIGDIGLQTCVSDGVILVGLNRVS